MTETRFKSTIFFAFHNSYSACISSQLSGERPNALDNFKAIIGETSDSPLIKRENVNQCITAFLDFYPSDMETPQHTTSYQGALGGNEATLKLAAELNNKKDFFKQIVKRFFK